MENSMSRVLIETVVKNTLKGLRDDPERNIRNLVDMALHFSGGRFQQRFFETAQRMLENENSPYYGLVRDLTSYADAEHLLHFGMNLGYNSCTYGARRIRQNEEQLGYNIPWTILFQMDSRSPEHLAQYDAAVTDGEKLGIYTWMLFAPAVSCRMLELIADHPDSAFFLFCEPEDITDDFLDSVSELKNVMPAPRYQEGREDIFDKLRSRGLPYSACCPYSENDLEMILNGDLLASVQQVRPVFAVLFPRPDCPEQFRRLTHQAVERARNEQQFQMVPWELEQDNQKIDEIISDDACSVAFDSEGHLWGRDAECSGLCLFDEGLEAVLQSACPKKRSEVSAK